MQVVVESDRCKSHLYSELRCVSYKRVTGVSGAISAISEKRVFLFSRLGGPDKTPVYLNRSADSGGVVRPAAPPRTPPGRSLNRSADSGGVVRASYTRTCRCCPLALLFQPGK